MKANSLLSILLLLSLLCIAEATLEKGTCSSRSRCDGGRTNWKLPWNWWTESVQGKQPWYVTYKPLDLLDSIGICSSFNQVSFGSQGVQAKHKHWIGGLPSLALEFSLLDNLQVVTATKDFLVVESCKDFFGWFMDYQIIMLTRTGELPEGKLQEAFHTIERQCDYQTSLLQRLGNSECFEDAKLEMCDFSSEDRLPVMTAELNWNNKLLYVGLDDNTFHCPQWTLELYLRTTSGFVRFYQCEKHLLKNKGCAMTPEDLIKHEFDGDTLDFKIQSDQASRLFSSPKLPGDLPKVYEVGGYFRNGTYSLSWEFDRNIILKPALGFEIFISGGSGVRKFQTPKQSLKFEVVEGQVYNVTILPFNLLGSRTEAYEGVLVANSSDEAVLDAPFYLSYTNTYKSYKNVYTWREPIFKYPGLRPYYGMNISDFEDGLPEDGAEGRSLEKIVPLYGKSSMEQLHQFQVFEAGPIANTTEISLGGNFSSIELKCNNPNPSAKQFELIAFKSKQPFKSFQSLDGLYQFDHEFLGKQTDLLCRAYNFGGSAPKSMFILLERIDPNFPYFVWSPHFSEVMEEGGFLRFKVPEEAPSSMLHIAVYDQVLPKETRIEKTVDSSATEVWIPGMNRRYEARLTLMTPEGKPGSIVHLHRTELPHE